MRVNLPSWYNVGVFLLLTNFLRRSRSSEGIVVSQFTNHKMIKAEAVIGPRSTSSCRLRLSRTLSSSALSSMASNPVAGALPESIVRCTRRDSTAVTFVSCFSKHNRCALSHFPVSFGEMQRLHRPISSKSMYKPAKISFSQRLTVSGQWQILFKRADYIDS